MNSDLIKTEDGNRIMARYAYGAAQAARMAGVSETTIRRHVTRLGVTRIAGPTVAGFVRFSAQPVDVVMPYHA